MLNLHHLDSQRRRHTRNYHQLQGGWGGIKAPTSKKEARSSGQGMYRGSGRVHLAGVEHVKINASKRLLYSNKQVLAATIACALTCGIKLRTTKVVLLNNSHVS